MDFFPSTCIRIFQALILISLTFAGEDDDIKFLFTNTGKPKTTSATFGLKASSGLQVGKDFPSLPDEGSRRNVVEVVFGFPIFINKNFDQFAIIGDIGFLYFILILSSRSANNPQLALWQLPASVHHTQSDISTCAASELYQTAD